MLVRAPPECLILRAALRQSFSNFPECLNSRPAPVLDYQKTPPSPIFHPFNPKNPVGSLKCKKENKSGLLYIHRPLRDLW